MIELSFKEVSTEQGEHGSTITTILAHAFDPKIIAWVGHSNGWWNVNVFITVFPSRKCRVEAVAQEILMVQPKEGPLGGVRMWDNESQLSAIAEMAFKWLNMKRDGSLIAPMPKIEVRPWANCTNCRHFHIIRMGSDEMEMDFRDCEGESVRDMQPHAGAYQPVHACRLFNMFLEAEWGLLSELNRLMEGGPTKGSLVNLGAGFATEPRWMNIREFVRRELEEKACTFHRLQPKPFRVTKTKPNRWSSTVANQVDQSRMAGVLARTGGGKDWFDIVPFGWMPKTDPIRVIGMGGIEFYNEELEAKRDVFESMQIEQERRKEPVLDGIHQREHDQPEAAGQWATEF